MADRMKTFNATFDRGLVLNQDALTLGTQSPGAAVVSVNYEPSLEGGYRRVDGHAKFDPAVVPGSGSVLGVTIYNDRVIAARKDAGATGIDLYASSGAGWGVAINPAPLATSATPKVRFHTYNWIAPCLLVVNGLGYASKWDGTTWTTLNALNAPTNPSIATTFRQHVVLSGYSSNYSAITIGEPNNDVGFDPAANAIEIVIGDKVVGLKTFRETLYVFCSNSIWKITGASAADFVLSPVTRNIGCLCGDSIQEHGGELLFLAPDGIRPIAATERLDDVEIASVSREVWPYIRTLISAKTASNYCSTVIRSKSQYRLFATSTTDTFVTAEGILGGLRAGPEGTRWEWSQIRNFLVTCADSGYINEDEYVIHGDYNGYVHRQDSGNSLDGENIASQLRTPFLPFDDVQLRKTLYRMDLYYKVEGTANISMATLIDYAGLQSLQPQQSNTIGGSSVVAVYGSATYGESTYGGTPTPVAQEYLIGSGSTFAFDFTTDDVNPSHTLQAVTIEYAVHGRR